MNRADGTGLPNASTFTRQSRVSDRLAMSAGTAGVRIATNHVPVDSTVASCPVISGYARAARRAAFESCSPQWTVTSDASPVRSTQRCLRGPNAAPDGARGAIRAAQPRSIDSFEGVPDNGYQRSV